MTDNQKMLLLQMASIIKIGGLTPVSYRKRDDYFLDSEINSMMTRKIDISLPELRELRSKPALIQTCDYSRNDTVSRLTQKGWEVAYKLVNEIANINEVIPRDEFDLWCLVA